MALALTPAQRVALRSGALGARVLLDLYFGSGRLSFWDGDEHATIDAANYIAAGAFGTISEIGFGTDFGADGMEVRLDATRLLNASPDPFDPVKVLASIHSEDYHQRRAEVRLLVFNAETLQPIVTARRFTGVIDQASIEETPDPDGGESSVALVLRLESIARRYGRRVGRTRTQEDQQELYPGDDFFRFVGSTVAKERQLYWGRMPPGSTVGPVASNGPPSNLSGNSPGRFLDLQ